MLNAEEIVKDAVGRLKATGKFMKFGPAAEEVMTEWLTCVAGAIVDHIRTKAEVVATVHSSATGVEMNAGGVPVTSNGPIPLVGQTVPTPGQVR